MTIWADTTTITNSTIIIMASIYLAKLYVEKKYGFRLPDSDIESLAYLSDKAVDQIIREEKKWSGVLKWFSRNKEPKENTILLEDSDDTYNKKKKIIIPSETIPMINQMQDEIENVKSDVVIMMGLFNKEYEHFEQEVLKLLETLKDCTPEEKAICLNNFIAIKKLINGHLTP